LFPPLVFFWSNPDHLKLLAYVPVLRRLVEPMGFLASPMMTSAHLQDRELESLTRALQLLVRWYKMWILAGLCLAVVLGIRSLRRLPLGTILSNRGINVIGATLLYLALWQFVTFARSPSWAVGYLASFAILGAVCLGFGFSVLIQEYCASSTQRLACATFLLSLFLVSPAGSRPPDLPFSISGASAPIPALYGLAEDLRTHIPPGSRVFHLGSFQPLYIAGLKLYLRQVFGAWTLTRVVDEGNRRKSGLWGEAEIRQWLERDAQYAVVVPTTLATYRAACNRCAELAVELLATHFIPIAVLDRYPGYPHIIYRRF
jgi:hypothetical protein